MRGVVLGVLLVVLVAGPAPGFAQRHATARFLSTIDGTVRALEARARRADALVIAYRETAKERDVTTRRARVRGLDASLEALLRAARVDVARVWPRSARRAEDALAMARRVSVAQEVSRSARAQVRKLRAERARAWLAAQQPPATAHDDARDVRVFRAELVRWENMERDRPDDATLKRAVQALRALVEAERVEQMREIAALSSGASASSRDVRCARARLRKIEVVRAELEHDAKRYGPEVFPVVGVNFARRLLALNNAEVARLCERATIQETN